jgi:hypothetical protein
MVQLQEIMGSPHCQSYKPPVDFIYLKVSFEHSNLAHDELTRGNEDEGG